MPLEFVCHLFHLLLISHDHFCGDSPLPTDMCFNRLHILISSHICRVGLCPEQLCEFADLTYFISVGDIFAHVQFTSTPLWSIIAKDPGFAVTD